MTVVVIDDDAYKLMIGEGTLWKHLQHRSQAQAQDIEPRETEREIEIHAAKATDAGGSGNRSSRTKGTNGMSVIGDEARRIEVKTKMFVTSLRVTACANANAVQLPISSTLIPTPMILAAR